MYNKSKVKDIDLIKVSQQAYIKQGYELLSHQFFFQLLAFTSSISKTFYTFFSFAQFLSIPYSTGIWHKILSLIVHII